jgi:hypothetical protein
MRLFPATAAQMTGAASVMTLLLLTPSVSASRTAECLKEESLKLAELSACGHKGSINYCLSNLIPIVVERSSTLLGHIEDCLANAGCSPAEAQIEAYWTLKRCDSPDELRKRQLGKTTTTPAANTQTQKTTPNAKATTTPKPAPATTTTSQDTETTDDTQTSSTSSDSGPSTVIVTASDTPSTINAGVTHTNIPPSDCFTTSMMSVTVCPIESTGVSSGKQMSCFPTTEPTAVCAKGLVCHYDAAGNPSCMVANNTVGISGIIVAIVFGSAVVGAFSFMIFFCLRERAQHRRLTAAAEAAAIARDAKNASNKARGLPVVSVQDYGVEPDANRPLIQQQYQPSMPHHPAVVPNLGSAPPPMDYSQGYGHPGAQDPFTDAHRTH